MVNTCTAYKCKSRFKKNSDVSFYRFPKDPTLCNAWVYAIRRLNFTPSKYSRLCSKHFDEDDYIMDDFGKRMLRKGTVPSIFDDLPKHLQKSRRKHRSARLLNAPPPRAPQTFLSDELQALEEFIHLPTATALLNDYTATETIPPTTMCDDIQELEEFIQFPSPLAELNNEAGSQKDKKHKLDATPAISICSFGNENSFDVNDGEEILLWVTDSEPAQELIQIDPLAETSTSSKNVPDISAERADLIHDRLHHHNYHKVERRPPIHFSDIDLEYLSSASTCKIKKVYTLAVDAIEGQRRRINTLIQQKRRTSRQIVELTKTVDRLKKQLSAKNDVIELD